MKYKTCIFSFVIICTLSCNHNKTEQFIKIKKPNGSILEGLVFSDSLFNGKVKYYDSLSNYLSYTTFKYGIKEGVEVSYYKSGKISDSLFYHNNMANGFAYKFDESGRLKYKSFYLNDRNLGHIYDYDENGNIKRYYFINFEGKIIFESMKKDSIIYTKGEVINANVYSLLSGNTEKDFLFLYLISSPYVKSHYEIAIVNSMNEIISSKVIISNSCFYEQEISDLGNGNLYAIVLHTYNPFKGRDDLSIKTIK